MPSDRTSTETAFLTIVDQAPRQPADRWQARRAASPGPADSRDAVAAKRFIASGETLLEELSSKLAKEVRKRLRKIPLRYVHGAEHLVTVTQDDPRIVIDAGVLARMQDAVSQGTTVRLHGESYVPRGDDERGLAVLAAVVRLFAAGVLPAKKKERRGFVPALLGCFEFLDTVRKKEPGLLTSLDHVLRGPWLDSDNVFALTIADCFDERLNSGGAAWREQRIAWLRAASTIDWPVSLEALRDVVFFEKNPDERNHRLLTEVYASADFDAELSRANVRRLRERCLEDGRTLFVSRFSRASYFITLLTAEAQILHDVEKLRKKVRKMERLLHSRRDDAGPEELREHLTALRSKLSAGLRDLEAVLSAPSVSKARLLGNLRRFEQRIDDYHGRIHAAVRSYYQKRRGRAPAQPKQHGVERLREFADRFAADVREAVDAVYKRLDRSGGRDAALSVSIQRASATGVWNLATTALGVDPFDTTEGLIEESLRAGGHNVLGESDNAWFEAADVILEAIGLYIHETDAEAGGAPIVIEQENFEKAIRLIGQSFRKNIADVILSEHVAVARDYAARLLGLIDDEMNSANPGAREEDVLQALRESKEQSRVRELVAGLSALVHQRWRERRREIAQRMEADSLPRVEALFADLDQDRSLAGLRLEELDVRLEGIDTALSSTAYTFRARDIRDAVLREDLALRRRRSVPLWIVLTTQAAGLTDLCAGFWFDDEMTCTNLTTAFTYGGRTLEEEAREHLGETRRHFAEIGRSVIEEFRLDYRIDEIIGESGADDSEAAVERAVLQLILRNRDVSRETAKRFVLWQSLPHRERRYAEEPPAAQAALANHGEELRGTALEQIIRRNPELGWDIEDGVLSENDVQNHPVYGLEFQNELRILARQRAIQEHALGPTMEWYTAGQSEDSLPRIIRMKLDLGMSTHRDEVLLRYRLRTNGTLIREDEYRETPGTIEDEPLPLFVLKNDPLFSYEARGGNKKYHRGYGPSRVDLGFWERISVQEWPQWIGPADRAARIAMENFYDLYNYDVRSFEDVRHAEESKPFENGIMEAQLALTHIFQALQLSIGVGHFQRLAADSTERPEIKVRPGGAGSTGFCQPKDIYYWYFVNVITRDEVYRYAGLPVDRWSSLTSLRRRLTDRLSGVMNETAVRDFAQRCESVFTAVEAAERRPGFEPAEHFEAGGEPSLFHPRGMLPSAAFFTAADRIGVRDPRVDPRGFLRSVHGVYQGKILQVLESRMRFVPVSLIFLLRQAFDIVRERRPESPAYSDAVIPLPVEYKPVSDARLSMGLRMFELMAAAGVHDGRHLLEHIYSSLDREGEATAQLLLNGFDAQDTTQRKLLAERLYDDGRELSDDDLRDLAQQYPRTSAPADIRLFTPFNMSTQSVYNYVSGSTLSTWADRVRRLIHACLARYSRRGANPAWSMSDEEIDANCLTYGARLRSWTTLKDLPDESYAELARPLGGLVHALVFDVRLKNPEYRAGPGTDLREAFRGSDVLPVIVHYDELTGSEDEGVEIERHPRRNSARTILDDLPRAAADMRDGRPESALILFDAPVQGRKTALDRTAIKTWLSLGGYYLSPAVGFDELQYYERDVREECEAAAAYRDTLLAGDKEKLTECLTVIRELARDRYRKARDEEELAIHSAEWWRGGGFYNWSERHALMREGWFHLLTGKGTLDYGLWLVAGGLFLVNGRPAAEVALEKRRFEEATRRLNGKEDEHAGFGPDAVQRVEACFVRPEYTAPVGAMREVYGERTSIKKREEAVDESAGSALERHLLQRRARSIRRQVSGYRKGLADATPNTVEALCDRAAEILNSVDLGPETQGIARESCGEFLAITERAFHAIVEECYQGEDTPEKRAMLTRGRLLFDAGRNPEAEAWLELAGRGDDPGDFGRLAYRCAGQKDMLRPVARVAGLFDVLFALIKTADLFNLTSDELNTEQETISRRLHLAVAEFFAETIYDHVFDYPWRIFSPMAGSGFSDYDYIMGSWLGEGTPFTREEIFAIQVEEHRWLGRYFDRLFRSRTYLRQAPPAYVDALLGTPETPPVGGPAASDPLHEREWFWYTHKRDLAHVDQQGHRARGIFDVSAGKAAELFDDGNRPAVAIVCPPGRPHLLTFFEENPLYNREHPGDACNWVLGRALLFDENDESLRIPHGFMYVDAEVFRRLSEHQKHLTLPPGLHANAGDEPRGVMIGVRFERPLRNCLSFPFHGAPYYLQGLDERIGLPSVQAWIHNILMYDKLEHARIHAPGRGVSVPEELHWKKSYQFHADGTPRDEDEIVAELSRGSARFPGGLTHFHWKCISKAARQSGGRLAFPAQLRDGAGNVLEENVLTQARNMARVGWIDDQVLQRLIPANPAAWASPEYLRRLRQELIRKHGIAAPADAEFFAYSRVIVVYVDEAPEYVLELTVASRAAVSNVGRGGVLFKWRPAFARDAATAETISSRRREAALASMHAIELRSDALWSRLTSPDDPGVIEDHQQLLGRRLRERHDRTGHPYSRPRYMMHDFLDTPVLRIGGDDELIETPEIVGYEYARDGVGSIADRLTSMTVLADNGATSRAGPEDITDWKPVLIENNIGFGLWNPFKEDERRDELQRARTQNRGPDPARYGGDLRKMMLAFSKAAREYLKPATTAKLS